MTKKSRTKTVVAPLCECGCGADTKGGRFLPGHDAKLKKVLIEAALGGSKRATTKLGTLGWSKFLDAKRETLAKKEQPKARVPRRGRRSGEAQAAGKEQQTETSRRRGRARRAQAQRRGGKSDDANAGPNKETSEAADDSTIPHDSPSPE
jgi:hypothetical protein